MTENPISIKLMLVFKNYDKKKGGREVVLLTPRNFNLQSPHLGVLPNFLVYRYTSLPPETQSYHV